MNRSQSQDHCAKSLKRLPDLPSILLDCRLIHPFFGSCSRHNPTGRGFLGYAAASHQEKTTFRKKRSEGWSVKEAAEFVTRSAAWGYKVEHQDDLRRTQREGGERIAPKPLGQLDGGVKDCLADFNLFAEAFLARRPVPWRLDAANRVVEWITDKSNDTYAVLNMPPRAGKTTLFTLDIPLWLICGGGVCDPEVGRAIRILLGHRVEKIAKQYVTLARNTLDLDSPFYCKEQKRDAELIFTEAFGRFRPKRTLGEFDLWRDSYFVVAQIGDRKVYNKEPTVQAASREGGFLGTRVDLSVWDDLVVTENCGNIEVAERTNDWWENEAEERIEPGGVNLLVGQRLSNLDLFRFRLDKTFVDGQGNNHKLYEHIVYPAHNDQTCPNGGVADSCMQWDARQEGCLLDASRLNPRKLYQAMSKGAYRTVFQQEDSNPEDVLVRKAWIYGGEDEDEFPADGCLDKQRGFYEWPDVDGLIDTVRVDPSVANFWAFEWWALQPVEPFTEYLIWGQRKKMLAGTDNGFLDFNPRTREHVGAMEEIQELSGRLGHPIRVWIIEQNAAHKYLRQTHAFQTWRQKWPMVEVLSHETQRNKNDEKLGIPATIPYRYKLGLQRLPYAKGVEVRNYMRYKIDELTKYPDYPTDDTVMADWFGHVRRREILIRAKAVNRRDYGISRDPGLPAYLQEPRAARYLEESMSA